MKRQIKAKICLCGDGAVGKTSLINRYVHNVFDESYLRTIGTKVSKKILEFQQGDTDVELNMQIWDIMGQPEFRDLLKDAYFFGASGVILVCDITRFNTYLNLEDWIDTVFKTTGDIPIVLFANKADMKDKMEVSEGHLSDFIARHKSQFYYTSARTGDHVEEGFLELSKKITENMMKDDAAPAPPAAEE
jgi:small GTP-binding protein